MTLTSFRRLVAIAAAALLITSVRPASADVKLPKVFGSNMVLQRDAPIPIWGWAEPGEDVTISVGDASEKVTTSADGGWVITLPAMKAGGPHSITVKGNNEIELTNVLVGEVWVCSGQSNMQWSVDLADDPDLEKLAANFPNIRLITVPRVGTQEPQNDFEGEGWQECSSETVGEFSAVGYFFGRQLHQSLNVPIGLIDNAWGGSACEAWIKRDVLEKHPGQYGPLLSRWDELATNFDYEAELAKWKERAKAARAAGKPVPRQPRNQLAGQHRPANLYNGVLRPIIGYSMRGVIWYQGETNASRAYQYRHMFPLMIQHWRDEWCMGDFPFYFVQLADFRDETPDPVESDWAELREAQTMTLSALPNTGQAVIVDLGESHDIHPKDKQNVAKRLARWALARDYGVEIAYRSPEYKSHEVKGNKIVITMDHVGAGLDTFDVRTPIGFAIAGADKQFVWAEAKVTSKNTIEVWSSDVAEPVSVRYGWANNPVCNLQNREGLPATPFRTDDWPGVTAEAK